MKIFSEIVMSPENVPVFALYVDTQRTGDPNKDCLYAAHDFREIHEKDADEMLEVLIPLLSELIYTAYSKAPEVGKMTPLTDWNRTGFDKNAK